MKFCWSGKNTCRWCYWRNSHNRERHYCEALPTISIPIVGCFCEESLCRKYGWCPLKGGMKEPSIWCDQGRKREGVISEVMLDNTCAMFRPLDLAHLDSGYHPLAVRRAVEKAKAKRKDRKSNPSGEART